MVLFLVLLFSVGVSASSVTVNVETTRTEYTWVQGTIQEVGEGLAPAGSSAAQARVLSRRVAIVDAQRRLAEVIEGIRIDSETLVRDLVLVNDAVRAAVGVVVEGAMIVADSEEFFREEDGSAYYTLMMEVKTEELMKIVYQTKVEQFGQGIDVEVQVNTKDQEHYTGVIIRVDHIGRYNPALTFRVLTPRGEVVYSTEQTTFDNATQFGLAAYIDSVADAKDRVGENPLIIEAIETVGPSYVDIVISLEDAERLKAHPRILLECRVALRY